MLWKTTIGMFVMLILFGALLAPGLAVGDRNEAGVEVERKDDGSRSVTPGSGSGDVELDLPVSAQSGHVSFVDRDHRAATSRQVEIAGAGGTGFASWWLNNERVARYDFPDGRVWEQDGLPYGLTHALSVDEDASTVVANVQGPTTAGDLPLVAGSRLVGWPGGEGPQPSVEREHLACVGCPLETAVSDAGLIAVADFGRVTLYAPDDLVVPLWVGDYRVSQGLEPLRLEGVDISADGTTIAVTTYEKVIVFRVPLSAPVAEIPNNSQTVAQVSSDGTYVVLGGFQSTARLFALNTPVTYEQQWARNVGHSWVTAVDVADDGTVVAGTLRFAGGFAGKAIAFDAQGGTLWECLCYGDYVDDVAITPDGSRAVVVSWGAFGGTAGDVFTAFDATTGDVLHRISGADEPGSLHSVSISDDGTQALAGGKAVHARQFGNGGQVYGIELP